MIANPCKDLIKTRLAMGLNQTDFWGRIGYRQSTGSRYENGSRPMPEPMKKLVEIAYGTKGDIVIRKLRGE
jgi:transcriptional regulator with XRE-family HTH domain